MAGLIAYLINTAQNPVLFLQTEPSDCYKIKFNPKNSNQIAINIVETKFLLKRLPCSAQFTLAEINSKHYKAVQELTSSDFNLSSAARTKRKNEFYSGRWCAIQCLIQKNETNLVILIGEDRAPIWPMGIIGSISHSDRLAAALLDKNTDCLAVGLDIQPVSSLTLAQDLKNIILHPLEIKRFAHQFNAIIFDLIFSAKETLFKALYPSCSVFFDHQDAEVFKIDSTQNILQIRLLRSLGSYWYKNQVFEVSFDYISSELVTWLHIKAKH
jgi:enterobactin synthetase component D